MSKVVLLAFAECCPCPDHPKIRWAGLSGSPSRLAVHEGVDLSDVYWLGNRHYDHSREFRANIVDTWCIWGQALNIIREEGALQ